MVSVGLEKNFVDTQGVSLTNDTDSKTYTQLANVTFSIDSNVTKHQLTNDTIDNVFSEQMGYIEAVIILTTTEIADLTTLTKNVDGIRPKKIWTLKFNDGANSNKEISFGGAQLKTFHLVDPGIGDSEFFIRIEAAENVSVA